MSSVPKVLLVSEPGKDGAFRHVEGLLRHLMAAGFPVGYAYSTRRTSPGQKRLLTDCEEHGVPLLDLKVGNVPHPRDMVAYRKLRRFVKTHGFKVVHAHSFKAGYLARRLRSVPVIYTPHAYYSMVPGRSISRGMVEKIERRLAKRGITVHVSPDERDYALEQLGVPEELHRMIPNCVNPNLFRPIDDEHRQDLRATMGAGADTVLIGAISRVSWQKDPETLLAAYDLAREEDEELELAVVGAEITKAIKSKHPPIHFEHYDKTPPFYQALDAYALPSRYEGLPITVLEAMATNLPLILSDVSGNRGFETLELNSLTLVPKESPEELARAMLELAARVRDGSAPDPNHREVVIERFTPERVYGELKDLYRELAG
jgi:glycosyltransferase involved in cell wall biosynthesis